MWIRKIGTLDVHDVKHECVVFSGDHPSASTMHVCTQAGVPVRPVSAQGLPRWACWQALLPVRRRAGPPPSLVPPQPMGPAAHLCTILSWLQWKAGVIKDRVVKDSSCLQWFLCCRRFCSLAVGDITAPKHFIFMKFVKSDYLSSPVGSTRITLFWVDVFVFEI